MLKTFSEVLGIIIVIISLLGNIYCYFKYRNYNSEYQVIERIDTIKDTIPTLKSEKLIYHTHDILNSITTQYDTVYTSDGLIDTIYETKDTVPVEVEVPITQKMYSDDSTYKAWVSGYKSKLDSINVYKKTVMIYKNDTKKYGIGPVVFGGYNFADKSISWGIGIGVQYNIFKW